MKASTTKRFVICGVLLFIAGSHAYAQYSIDWFKISGGGGTSTSSVYTVSGTIGQHDSSGPMTNGNYSLTGGFWSILAVVPTPGPTNISLSISASPNGTVLIAWPYPSTGFTLKQTSPLQNNNWLAVTNEMVHVGQQ